MKYILYKYIYKLYKYMTSIYTIGFFFFSQKEIMVRAKYDFAAKDPGELSIKRGEIITVLDNSDQNWWTGRCQGKEGLFPAPYVECL